MFKVKASHVLEWDQELYYQLVYFPAEIISCVDLLLKDLFTKLFIEDYMDAECNEEKNAQKDNLMVLFTDLDRVSDLRSLLPSDINKLVSFQGIVVRCS